MESKKVRINKTITSQQVSEDGNPIISLIDGDVVELKEDGIYLTRRILFNMEEEVLETIYKGIEDNNSTNPSLN